MPRHDLFSTYFELHCTLTVFLKLHLLVQAAEGPGSNLRYKVSMFIMFSKIFTSLQGAVAHSWVYCQRSYSWIGRISRLITVTYLLFELLSKLLQFLVTLPFHSDFLMISRRSTSTAILNLRQPVVQSVTLFCCTFHRCHLMLPSVSFIFSSNSPSWVFNFSLPERIKFSSL